MISFTKSSQSSVLTKSMVFRKVDRASVVTSMYLSKTPVMTLCIACLIVASKGYPATMPLTYSATLKKTDATWSKMMCIIFDLIDHLLMDRLENGLDRVSVGYELIVILFDLIHYSCYLFQHVTDLFAYLDSRFQHALYNILDGVDYPVRDGFVSVHDRERDPGLCMSRGGN